MLLVVAQVLAGKAQQQEGGTRQGTEREAQRHLAHDGSLCHSQCVAAHSGNSVGDDRHNTVVVGVRVKQQAQRNAEQADDGGNEGAHAGGDDGDQSVGHGSQHTGIFDHTGECTCGKDDGDHQECGLCMTVDDLVLQIHTGVVDDEQDAVADHKGDSRAEAVGNEDVQDDQDQCHIEVPAPAGAGQFVGGVGGLCFGQTGDLLRGDACSNALGFLFAQESRDEQAGHQACDPGGHDAHPQLAASDFIAQAGHGCGCTDRGAAPGHNIHDTGGQRHDGSLYPEVHFQLLEQGHTGGDGNQEGGGTGAIQMADAADEEGADTDLDGVFAGKLQDAVDDRIKDTGIRAGTEKQDGKDEHDTCGNDAAQALAHIICAEDGKCLGKAGAERDDRLNISSSGLFGSSLCGLDDDIGGVDECCDEAGDGGNKDQSYKGRDLLAHDQCQHQQNGDES